MEIILAKTAGFCFGVNRAVKLTYEQMCIRDRQGSDIVSVCPKQTRGGSGLFYRIFNANSHSAYPVSYTHLWKFCALSPNCRRCDPPGGLYRNFTQQKSINAEKSAFYPFTNGRICCIIS